VEEYLRTAYEPRCEYWDGVLVEKPMGTRKHGKLQLRISNLIEQSFPRYEAIPEQTVRITGTKYLLPDIAIVSLDAVQDPYPVEPVHLCIEIVSPGDRVAAVLEKCAVYHDWGTLYTWVIDPQNRRAWQYEKGSKPVEVAAGGELLAGDIHVPVADIFSVLR
jgi:Uma2 family endonuclease